MAVTIFDLGRLVSIRNTEPYGCMVNFPRLSWCRLGYSFAFEFKLFGWMTETTFSCLRVAKPRTEKFAIRTNTSVPTVF
jgi:hypothetical protein